MIRSFKPLWIGALIAMAVACSEDDPLPLPTIDFTNPIAEVGVPVMFDNLSTNADRYEWSFSDGQTSDQISPSITFDEAGPIEVVLRAFTQDGQVDSLVRNITIRQRFLVSYVVKSFPSDSLGFAWDKDASTEEEMLPDILVLLVATSADNLDNGILGPVFINAKDQDVSNIVEDDIILTDEEWVFELSDWDGTNLDQISLADDPFSPIISPTFNPVQILSSKSDDGTEGNFSITGFTSDDQFVDIAFFFELR